MSTLAAPQCSICMNPAQTYHIYDCGHGGCALCLSRWIVDANNTRCHECRAPVYLISPVWSLIPEGMRGDPSALHLKQWSDVQRAFLQEGDEEDEDAEEDEDLVFLFPSNTSLDTLRPVVLYKHEMALYRQIAPALIGLRAQCVQRLVAFAHLLVTATPDDVVELPAPRVPCDPRLLLALSSSELADVLPVEWARLAIVVNPLVNMPYLLNRYSEELEMAVLAGYPLAAVPDRLRTEALCAAAVYVDEQAAHSVPLLEVSCRLVRIFLDRWQPEHLPALWRENPFFFLFMLEEPAWLLYFGPSLSRETWKGLLAFPTLALHHRILGKALPASLAYDFSFLLAMVLANPLFLSAVPDALQPAIALALVTFRPDALLSLPASVRTAQVMRTATGQP